MAITADDLLAPNGPVEPTLFQGEDIEGDVPGSTILKDRLEVYIAQASAKNAPIAFTDPDEADKLYALYLTFHAAWIVSIARPSMENAQVPVLGSESYAKDQRDALHEKALYYLDEYRGVLAEVPTTTSQIGPPSRSTALNFEW